VRGLSKTTTNKLMCVALPAAVSVVAQEHKWAGRTVSPD
jgi:hypothetical protein